MQKPFFTDCNVNAFKILQLARVGNRRVQVSAVATRCDAHRISRPSVSIFSATSSTWPFWPTVSHPPVRRGKGNPFRANSLRFGQLSHPPVRRRNGVFSGKSVSTLSGLYATRTRRVISSLSKEDVRPQSHFFTFRVDFFTDRAWYPIHRFCSFPAQCFLMLPPSSTWIPSCPRCRALGSSVRAVAKSHRRLLQSRKACRGLFRSLNLSGLPVLAPPDDELLGVFFRGPLFEVVLHVIV